MLSILVAAERSQNTASQRLGEKYFEVALQEHLAKDEEYLINLTSEESRLSFHAVSQFI